MVEVDRRGAERPVRIRAGSLCFALLLMLACHTRPSEPANRLQIALAPSGFPERLNLQQHVHVQQAGHEIDFEAVLDIAPDAVTLVGLSFGQRLFTMRYDGSRLEESRSPMLPREVHGRDILSDIQLALWPTEAVRGALPAGWTLQDSTERRVLSKDGQEMTTISYDGSPRWKGLISLDNHQFGYRLVIRSAPSEP